MFVADTFGVSAPPLGERIEQRPNMRTEELLLLPPPVRRPPRRGKSLLREEQDLEGDKETLPTVLEHAEATRMYYLLVVVVRRRRCLRLWGRCVV